MFKFHVGHFQTGFVFMLFLMIGINLVAASAKPSPGETVKILTLGNKRFYEGKSRHLNTDAKRLRQAGTENQGDHAYATVLTCSDSRVPVERIFDAGVMDIFVVRVAGNVCNTDEVGSIEYGVCHVKTPVLVILGHTQCGAVTAVANELQGHGHPLERNIPPLVAPIVPAVKKTMKEHPHLHGGKIIPLAIKENVWQAVNDLFMKSPAVRNYVKEGKVKVLGAIYDVGTGKVEWLPEDEVAEILKEVEKNPQRARNPMAEASSSVHH